VRIAFYNYHYDVSGSSRGAKRQIQAIAAGLARLGHEVDLQFRAAAKPGALEESGGLKKVGWLRWFVHVPRLVLRNIPLYRRECSLIESFHPDVVLAVHHYCNLSAMLAARKCGVPFVLFTETPMEYEYSLFYRQFYSYPVIGRFLERVSVRAAREVICISEILKAYLVRYGVQASRLHVIPNGVDHEAFAPLPPDRHIEDRLQLQGKLVVGFVGTFQFFWSVQKFVNVIQNVLRQCPDVRFLFVGSGDAGESIAREGRVRGLSNALLFAGDVSPETVPDWLSVMDVVVCPYRGDYLFYGSPMKVLEYMAAGKPALCAALGQIRELIADGYNGALFEWDDGDALQRKLLQLLGDAELRAALGRNARQTIEQGWTWDHQVRRIERVLERAARGG